MKVEVLEGGIKDAPYFCEPGDIVTIPDDLGKNWCSYGWAKDVDGVVPTGERDSRPKTVTAKTVTNAGAVK